VKLFDIIASTSYLVEAIGIPGQWTWADYSEAANWACKEAARLINCTVGFMPAITCVAGDNRLHLSPAPVKVLGVKDTAMAKVLLASNQPTENALNASWRYLSGIPTAYFEEAGNLIRLNRKVEADTSFDVEVVESPSLLVSDSDTVDPRLPDHVQRALRYGAAFFLLTQAGDPADSQKAQGCLNQFRELVTGHVAAIKE
jgi:hypothetical protein